MWTARHPSCQTPVAKLGAADGDTQWVLDGFALDIWTYAAAWPYLGPEGHNYMVAALVSAE